MNTSEIVAVWTAGRSPQTAAGYKTTLAIYEQNARKTFNKNIEDVGVAELLALQRLRTGIGPRTQGRDVWVLRSFFGAVAQLGLRSDNPALALRAPKYEDSLADRLIGHEEVERLISAVPHERDRLLLSTLYVAGLRISEALRLRRVDLVAPGTLRIFGKGQRTEYVRVPDEFWTELQRWASIHDPLFDIGRTRAHVIVKDAARASGNPRISCHWLRHAHATEALRQGAPITVVQKSLRHRQIQTTLKYTHVRPEEGSALVLPALVLRPGEKS